jgi:methyl-accepting chemotaxis protein
VASFTERIAVIIDVTADKATKGLKDFRTSVQEAEGFTGKLKAGVGSLGGVFKGAAANPAVLAAGVTAAAGAAFAAVESFSQLGVEVGKFSDATGVTTEEASRLIEVSNDLGVSTESLQGALNKLNKGIDPKAFKDLGVAIAYTDNGATDVNATFMNVIAHLNGIKDPAQRAREGTKLLGKSWTDLAELVGMGADELQKALDGVSKAKVLSPEQVKKSKAFRDAMDNLRDVSEDLAITIGSKLTPALVLTAEALKYVSDEGKPVLDILGGIVDEVSNPGLLQKFSGWLSGGLSYFDMWKLSLDALSGKYDDVANSAGELWPTINGMGDSAKETAEKTYLLEKKTRGAAEAAAEARDRFSEARQKLKDLQDEISGRKSLVDLKISLKANADKLAELKEKFDKGKIAAEDYMLAVESTALDSEGAVASYAEAIGNIPPEAVTDIVTKLDPSAPEKVFNTLQQWFDNHKLFVTVGGMIVDPVIRNVMEGRGTPAPPAGTPTKPPAGSVDGVLGTGNRSLGAGRPMVIQLQLNDRTVQEIAIRADQLKVGRT